jgi:hypothetical protein
VRPITGWPWIHLRRPHSARSRRRQTTVRTAPDGSTSGPRTAGRCSILPENENLIAIKYLTHSCVGRIVSGLTAELAPLMPRLDTRCPKCLVGVGVPTTVETVPGHMYKVVVTVTCNSCGHQWRIERLDILPPRDDKK